MYGLKRSHFNFRCIKELLFFSFLLTVLLGEAQNPSLSWAKQLSGQGNSHGSSIITDKFGNIYSCGHFSNGNVDFDPGPDTFNLSSNYYYSVYIEKLNPAGDFLWAKIIGGTNDILSGALMPDNLGNIYIAGSFIWTADFDPGPGTSFLTSTYSATNRPDFFILKLSMNGDFLWVHQIADSTLLYTHSMAIDSTNNLYVTGIFNGIHDFDPGPTVFNLFASDLSTFILKSDPDGALIWVKQIGVNNPTFPKLSMDVSDNIIISGVFSDTVDFDPGPGVFNLISVNNNEEYTVKLDINGDFIWVKQQATHYINNQFHCLTTDPSGNIFRAGLFGDTVDFDPGPGVYNMSVSGGFKIYMLKLSPNGIFKWAKQFAKSGDYIFDISTDGAGNIYSLGTFQTTSDFDPGDSVFSMSLINGNVYILKLSPEGNFMWARQLKTGVSSASSIYADTHNNLFNTGNKNFQTDFDPDTSSFYLPASNHCSYILKWNQCAPAENSIIAESCFNYILNNLAYSSSGNYIQFLTSAAGCDSLLTINLTINTLDTSVIQSGNTLVAADTTMSYQWVDCDNGFTTIPGETNQIFIPTIPGNYALIGSNNNCSDTSSCYTITSVGFEENITSNVIRIYPNPTNGNYSINPGKGVEELDLEVWDVLGRQLEARHLHKSEYNNLRLEGPKGIYFVAIKIGDTTITIKLLK